MTRKAYKAIAAAIKEAFEQAEQNRIDPKPFVVNKIANSLEHDVNFDRARFNRACDL